MTGSSRAALSLFALYTCYSTASPRTLNAQGLAGMLRAPCQGKDRRIQDCSVSQCAVEDGRLSRTKLAMCHCISVRLRGGGDSLGEQQEPDERLFVVPSIQCPTLQAGLDMTCKGDTCFVAQGRHSFEMPGPYPVDHRSLCMKGEDGAWIVGRWFSEESTCNMSLLSFYADPNDDTEEDDRAMHGRVVLVVGGVWVLSSCAIQCIDGTPLGECLF